MSVRFQVAGCGNSLFSLSLSFKLLYSFLLYYNYLSIFLLIDTLVVSHFVLFCFFPIINEVNLITCVQYCGHIYIFFPSGYSLERKMVVILDSYSFGFSQFSSFQLLSHV